MSTRLARNFPYAISHNPSCRHIFLLLLLFRILSCSLCTSAMSIPNRITFAHQTSSETFPSQFNRSSLSPYDANSPTHLSISVDKIIYLSAHENSGNRLSLSLSLCELTIQHEILHENNCNNARLLATNKLESHRHHTDRILVGA